jgi:group I intron endonuclease
MIGIYKITNPKGKIYIGQSINIDRRFKEYKKIQCSQSIKLYNSFQKYGVENHIFEILENCNTDQLNEKEEFYIKFFNSHIKGLNIKLASKPSWTGKKRPEHSIFLKENGCGLSYERTQEHKDNLSTMMKEVWNNKKEEIGKKITQGKKGKGLKPIICDTLFGMEFKSLTEASEILNLNKGNICEVLKGSKTHVKGFVFRYKDFVS